MYIDKLLVALALSCSILSGCSSLSMLEKQSVKVLEGTTVVTSSGERYYFEGNHIFDGKVPSKLRKIKLVSETVSITGYFGDGLGGYSLGTDSFQFLEPTSSSSHYIGENGVASIGDFRLLKKESIKENDLSWDVFYICSTYRNDEDCKGAWKADTWKVTHGDVFSLRREIQ